MIQAENQVRQIVAQYPVQEAPHILLGILQTKNPIEQLAMVGFLQYYGQTDFKAQAILGYLLNSSG